MRTDKLDNLLANYAGAGPSQFNFDLQESFNAEYPNEEKLTQEEIDYFYAEVDTCIGCGWNFYNSDLVYDISGNGYCYSCDPDIEEE